MRANHRHNREKSNRQPARDNVESGPLLRDHRHRHRPAVVHGGHRAGGMTKVDLQIGSNGTNSFAIYYASLFEFAA
jgi:hypothetical protein